MGQGKAMELSTKRTGSKRAGSERSAAARWLRLLLTSLLVAGVAAASCTPGFDVPSDVNTLRILAVTVDKPYAKAGDEITLRMTVFDALGDPEDPESGSRTLQILWLGGCFDPPGDQYFACLPQLAETLAPLAGGEMPPEDVLKLDIATPALSGVPDALEFSFTLPDDIITRRPKPEQGPHYGLAYVFFAACAGQIAPAPLETLGGQVPEFPLDCLDEDGNKLGSDSFVIGYTQVYAFADERPNINPPIKGFTLDDVEISEDPAEAPVVKACPISAEERRVSGCNSADPFEECTTYELKATIDDVAEIDPGATDADGNPIREVVWVSYFADAGDMSTSLSLVSDAVKGYLNEHETEWIAPAEPGLVTLWAVVRDQRGGSSVVRRFVRVEL